MRASPPSLAGLVPAAVPVHEARYVSRIATASENSAGTSRARRPYCRRVSDTACSATEEEGPPWQARRHKHRLSCSGPWQDSSASS